jgi:uncharacterized protein (DUF2235 family)
MGKRIILCFDGTWNNPESNTNIFKIYSAMEPQSGEQIVHYIPGVGSSGSKLQRVVQGGTGEGILQKIRLGYDALARDYEPGDKIYIYGFSRGAFAARCLASIVSTFGLPTRYFGSDPATSGYTKKLGDRIFKEYRLRGLHKGVSARLSNHSVAPVPIEMVGVFDTVSSLGLSALFGKADLLRYGFLDADWHPNIKNSYQALALDEKRSEFAPVRWKEGPLTNVNQRMEQVWFAGAHSDVGGGYHSTSSLAPLNWMIQKAQKHGVTFDMKQVMKYSLDAAANPGKLHKSWSLAWGIPIPRDIPSGSTISSTIALHARDTQHYLPFNKVATVAADGTDLKSLERPRKPGEWVGPGMAVKIPRVDKGLQWGPLFLR